MFEEIIRVKSATMEKAITRLLSNYSDPMERLIKLTDFYCEDLFRHQNYYLLIMQVLSLPAKYGKIKDYVFERRNRIHDLISTIVQNGQEKEIFRQDVNPLIMAFILFGTVNSSVVNSEHYRAVNGMTDWPQTKFTKHLIETVGQQVKKIVLEMVRLPQ